MNKIIATVTVIFSLFFVSCKENKNTTEVTKTNPARDLLMQSINAHGGLDKWYNNGPLKFRWKYFMLDKGPDVIVDSVQTVDPKTLAAIHEVPGKDIKFGFNAGQYWITPKEANFTPPARFWTLTPFYFVGIPFVFNDPNALFEVLPETMAFEGKDYTQLKISYNSAAGDSPEDYYVLLIDPQTNLVKGTYYIVTSKLVAPNGPGPEKFLTLDGLKDYKGIKLATSHRTFKMENGKITTLMRKTEISQTEFVPVSSVNFMIPADAKKL